MTPSSYPRNTRSLTPRIFAASHDSRSRTGTRPVLSGVCSLVPARPDVPRQKTTSRPSRAHRATLPAMVNSWSSGGAEMQRIRVSDAAGVGGRGAVPAIEPGCPRLAAHVVRRRPRAPQRRREVGELAEQRPRVARVDDLLDPEGLRRAERRAELGQPLFDLGHPRLRIRSRGDLRPIRGFDPAFERPRAPASGGPGVARAVTAAGPVGGAGDAGDVTDDHRAPGRGRLPDRRHRAHALLDGAGLLGILADQEAGAVDEIDDRQVEGPRDVPEAPDLPAGGGRSS